MRAITTGTSHRTHRSAGVRTTSSRGDGPGWWRLAAALNLPSLPLRHAGKLEAHRDAREAVRLGGGADALDRDVHPLQRHARLPGVHLDERHAAGRDAGEKCLAVGEGIGPGVRRRVEGEALAPHVAHGPTDRAAARGPDRVDLVTAHDGSSVQAPQITTD